MATAGSTGSINLTKKASPKVLERFKFGSCTEGLFSHAYSWTGVATVQIYSIDTLPLNDYNPEKVDGGSRFGNLLNVGDTIQELTVKDNKSFIGVIEETYNTQQMQIKRAGQIIRRQTDEVMIPYVDKYRLNRLASYATAARGNLVSAALTSSNILSQIMVANAAMSEQLVPDTGRVLYMTYGEAIKLKLTEQIAGAGPLNKGSIGEKAIVNGVIGTVDKCQIKLVPTGYLPAGVAFMIVKSGEAFAPTQIKSYKIHDGAHVLDGKIVTGHLLHDCFIPEGREKCVFVVTDTSADSNRNGVVSAATLNFATATGGKTVTSNAVSVVKSTHEPVAFSLTGCDIIEVYSADETKGTVTYDATTGLATLHAGATAVASGGWKVIAKAAGRPGYASATQELAVTITNS